MTRSLGVELGRHGITVNSVSPGFIDTPMARRAIEGGKFSVTAEQIVAGLSDPAARPARRDRRRLLLPGLGRRQLHHRRRSSA